MANEDRPKEFWPSFGDSSEFVEVTCENPGRSLAADVLTYFGISCNSSRGGDLPNLDIKHMDAIQIVKLSLLQESADTNNIYEPIMNEDGSVDFKAIGTYIGLSGGDIYYEIQTGTYRERAAGVLVTGGKPLPYREPVVWKPIWQGGTKLIYDTGMLYNSCIKDDFNQYCTIVFNDPHLDTRYEDGINNLYEITNQNPWSEVMGYAKYISFDNWKDSPDTTIQRSTTAKLIQKLEGPNGGVSLGTLQKRPGFVEEEVPAACFEGQGDVPDYSQGVKVVLPEEFRFQSTRNTYVDKFLGILDVYVVGQKIDDLRGRPKDKATSVKQDPVPGDAEVWVRIEDYHEELFKLERGKHYVVAYTETEDAASKNSYKQPYIVFSDNSRLLDPTQFVDNMTFYIDPFSPYADATGAALSQTGTILPTSNTTGILVKEVWVSFELETPSIIVYDPDGFHQKAKAVAESLEYQLAPLVHVEEPPPMAFNGTLVDQTTSIRDHDPTTAQNFEDTELERIMDAMDGGGMSLNLSFLDSDQVKKLSGALYDYINSGDGTEATYVCGPDTNVELGGTAPNGGVVNSISYSYQDSNSYTISVNAGPKLLGNFAQISSNLNFKQSENDTGAKGTVIADMGNHIFFKVRIDGYGERVAVNMSPDVIRVGDKVQCSINNNPVEA